MSTATIVVGLDNGGTSNNVTVIDRRGTFLIDRLLEVPSRVTEGPEVAVEALVEALNAGLTATGFAIGDVAAVGLDTPGPASADGVLSSKGGTNLGHIGWRGFDIRTALQDRLGLAVTYNNDGNAAALYAHSQHFGPAGVRRSSVSAIVGTGLGGGVVQDGRVVSGAAGMGGELGHVHIPMHGLLEDDQPLPSCNCGFSGDVESVASLTGIRANLLPYWLTRYPSHATATMSSLDAAKAMRGLAVRGDEMALKIFEQQAKALAALFTIAANFTDPDAFFVGGGVVEAEPHFRDWFLQTVRDHTSLRDEQADVAFALVPHLDMAGARGSALAALATLPPSH